MIKRHEEDVIRDLSFLLLKFHMEFGHTKRDEQRQLAERYASILMNHTRRYYENPAQAMPSPQPLGVSRVWE